MARECTLYKLLAQILFFILFTFFSLQQHIHQILNLKPIYLAFYLNINLACLSVCLSVRLYPLNVKTAEPIGPKFCVGHNVTPGKVYE